MLSRAFDTYRLAGDPTRAGAVDWGTARREREAIAIQRDVIASEERLRRPGPPIDPVDVGPPGPVSEWSPADDNTIIELRERVLRETCNRHAEGW
ncbi:MAG: hypothetical protein IPK85_21155 [Gemmatimonadetes bacterium]|nr:hypothetical protein [Gemmatimonadota bacterium]